MYSDELFITTGASFGVTLVSIALFEAGDLAFVADPTYFLVFNMLRMAKLNLTSGMHKMDQQHVQFMLYYSNQFLRMNRV